MERLYFAFEAEGKVRLSEEEKNALRSFSKYQEEIEKLQTAKAIQCKPLRLTPRNRKLSSDPR